MSEELREQLEEFALSMKPGTTKGKHRTAVFDTVELTKLVEYLITQELNKFAEEISRDVIGDDETVKTLRQDKFKQSMPWQRNQLRATQRTALTAKLDEWRGRL